MTRAIRLYTEQSLADHAEVRLEAGPARHLIRVLRRRAGDTVVLFSGDGYEYSGTITEAAGSENCTVRLDTGSKPAVESPLAITLVQAIGRGERMDWCIQKATELGVSTICPVFTERTEVRLSAARAARRLRHWQGVAIAACEQSGRCCVPEIHSPQRLTAAPLDPSPRFFLDPDAKRSPGDLERPDPLAMLIAIGPEGGFSEIEIDWLQRQEFLGLRLGPRILRTETAGPGAIAALQSRFGDWQ